MQNYFYLMAGTFFLLATKKPYHEIHNDVVNAAAARYNR